MKKWKPFLAVLAIGVILAGTVTSVAYFTSKDTTENVFTVGKIDISLEEPNWDENVMHTISADAVYKKDPTVSNTGTNDAYVRIRVIVSDLSAFKKADADYACREMFGTIGENWVLAEDAKEDATADTVEYVYCYKNVLPASEATEPLFENIKMPSFADETMTADMDGSFDVTVYADAIQADGFEDYEEAFKAFDEQNNG